MAIPALYTVVPSFSLPDLQGRTVSLWDYKHRRPVVLVFCDEDNGALLGGFAQRYSQYGDEGAEVLAITLSDPQRRDWPFPVLRDAEGQVSARLVQRTPAVLVLDSYNELQACFEGPWQDGPNHREILAAIAQAELKCPECGVPEWPNP